VPLFDTMPVHQGKGSGTPTEPHHTPSLKADTSHPTTSSIPLPFTPTAPIPPVTQTDTTPISMQHTISELTALCTSLQRQHSELLAKFQAQEVEILRLKERVQVLEDREGVAAKQSGDDAPIKKRSINEGEAAAKRISNDLEDIARVLTSMDAATVLAGGIDVPTSSGSIPTAGPPATVISTGSEVGPTASLIVTSYSRRKGKEVMLESDNPKKQRLQEQIDAQVSRELEKQQEKEDMRMNEQIARDAEVARIHAEEELQGMIDSLDKSNETLAKYLQEYKEFASELPLEKRIELISDLVKYQTNYSKWKLYDLTGVYHVTAKDKEIFMLVEKDYPLRKGLALVMISYKLQVENYSQMAEDLIRKIYNIANTPRQQDEPASPVRDVSKGEACPTGKFPLPEEDRATIAKSSTLPHDSAPRVTSPVADEGILEDRESVAAKHFRDDAPIKGRSINEGEVAAERISNDSEEIARVLTSMDAATVLAGGIDVPTGSGSIPTAADISTGSEVAPTASIIVTFYSIRKHKEVMVESDTLKKQRLQEQIDAQVARELEEQQEKEDIRMNEQIARDVEVARIHAEEELQGMIDSLDRSNKTIAKYLQEYQDFSSELPLEKRIELINDLVEGFIPMGSKEEAERLKRKGLNLEQEHVKKQKTSEEAPKIKKSTEEISEEKIKEMMRLVPIEDVYVQSLQVKLPIIDWKVHTEGQMSYWKIIRLGGNSACYQFFIDLLKQLDMEDLNQIWALVKEYISIRPATSEKKMELWVELKRLYEPDPEDQLWVQTQKYMHAPTEWKLYDLSGVHHVTAKYNEIFMLVEKDYPLRKGLALVMISYKL
nr:hypothetical protein [Tanacetum cinerariifolium]